MDISRSKLPYVSCIKIRGVPIVPPLMTDEIRTEMKYYKNLAVAVEERLKNLEIAALADSDCQLHESQRESVSSTQYSSVRENVDATINAIMQEVSNYDPKISIKNPDASIAMETTEQTLPQSGKSVSDEETIRHNENSIENNSLSSDTVTASTDINQYINGSFISDTVASTVENSPETRKPQVPKTLDIVPIIVNASVPPEMTDEGKPEEPTEDSVNYVNSETSQSTTPDSDETTPKLVRQGSYVLDNPSPMLLAHLQEKFDDNTTYVPTSLNGAAKRKEWNINQAKSEWELHGRTDGLLMTESSKETTFGRFRRNSASGASDRKAKKCSRSGGKYLAGTRQVARSADCIRSMLYRETTVTMNSKSSCVNKIKNRSQELMIRSANSSCNKSSKNVSILGLANKFGGSLGCLNYVQSLKRATPVLKQTVAQIYGSSDNSENTTLRKSKGIERHDFRSSTDKLLSAVTSEKLVNVFNEIQKTHERQMIELVARQRKEQENMQKEFEKQQLLLLAQIEQTFPGMSLPRLAEKADLSPQSSILTRHNANSTWTEKIATSLPKSMKINGSHSPEYKNSKCPLDDIYPCEELRDSSLCRMKQSQSTQTFSNRSTTSPPIGIYAISMTNGNRRQSGVSRRLFPLESKTRRVPVIDDRTYDVRHIKAATVITAYARGYLVRRLMDTERVIALKTTYREALHCMLKLHVDAPLALPELNFHQRLQLQCDAASMNIVELFAQDPSKRMEIIRHDRQIRRARNERPNSARSHYSFATQRTLARKKLKEMGDFQTPIGSRPSTARTRCQTWASNARENRQPTLLNQGIKRSTSAGAVRKPWR